MNLQKRHFHQEITERFSKDELRVVCFGLGINSEELDDKTISTLTESLLLYVEKRGRIADLLQLLAEERADVDWATLALEEVACPYRGLLPFREEDAQLFFGRDTYIERLLNAVDKQQLVAVIGPSGSGKSSVVFAGLLPRLRQTGNWQAVVFSPGKAPFDALASALIPHLEPQLSKTDQLRESNKLSADLNEGKTSLAQVMALLHDNMAEGQQLLLIIDQFEELYTQSKDTAEQERFMQALLSLAHCQAVTVLLTMRADFMGRALLYRPFADELQEASQMIGPMNRHELIDVIERPLTGTFVAFEPGLTTQILDDVGQEPGNLPLLEFALTTLWDEQTEGKLTFAIYEKIGKVEGALARHAENIYETIQSETEEAQMRRLFMQLVQPVTGTVNTKRKAKHSELGNDLWPLTLPLANARLIVTGQDEHGEEIAELTHEAMITNWPRFEGWIQQDWEFRAWQERLRGAISGWKASGQDKEALLRSAQLGEAQSWYDHRIAELSDSEFFYIKSSLEEEQKRDQRRRIYTGIAGIAAGLFFILAILFGLSRQDLSKALVESEQLRSEVSSALDESEQLQEDLNFTLSTSDASLIEIQTKEAQTLADSTRIAEIAAEAVAAEAIAISEGMTSEARLLAVQTSEAQTLADSTRIAEIAIEAQDAEAIALTAEAIAIAERDETERQRRVALGQSLASLSMMVLQRSNDTELATLLALEALELNQDKTETILWLADTALRTVLSTPFYNNKLSSHEAAAISVAFSPDGRTLASGNGDGTIKLWDLSKLSNEPVNLSNHKSSVLSIAFSPDNKTLASGSGDNTIQLWNLSDLNTAPIVLAGHESSNGIISVAFSHDSKTLASGSDDNTIQLWNLSDPNTTPIVLTGHENDILSVAFSPDGRTLASGSHDHTIRLWDLGNPSAIPIVLTDHKGSVRSVAFSSDGKTLASGSNDRTIRLWNLDNPDTKPVILSEHEEEVVSLKFSPNGKTLASGNNDSTIQLWDLDNLSATPIVLTGHEDIVWSVAFSPDSKTLASGSADRTIRLWNLGVPNTAPITLIGHEDTVWSVTFSPDGQILASGSSDNTIRLWNLDNLKTNQIVLSGHEDTVMSVAFSPNGKILASGSRDKTIRLWNLNNPNIEPIILTNDESGGRSVIFSPDGQTLASNSEYHTIRLWDLDNPSADPITLYDHNNLFSLVAFSPDGKTLASSSHDYTIHMWDLDNLNADSVILSGHKDFVSAIAFSPDGKTLASSSMDKTIRLWNLSAPSAEPIILTDYDTNFRSVAFSPDGQTLASGNDDNIISLWNLNNPRTTPAVLSGHEGTVLSLTFSPDGQTLASGSSDNTIRLWIVHKQLIKMGCQKVQRNLSWAEWQLYVGDETYEQTCPNLPPHPSVP